MKIAVLVLALPLILTGCGGGQLHPAALDTKNEQCASCRMAVSETRFASQIVAPGEAPRFFDDLGCLRDFLKANTLVPGAAIFVADHRTAVFVPADAALYFRAPGLETPMGSHLIAHFNAGSRAADPAAVNGTPVHRREVLGR